jgi:hypothetical protein
MENKSKFNCHICGEPFNIFPQADGGVIVRCDTKVGCIENENVFGCGKNEKEAAEVAAEKYFVSKDFIANLPKKQVNAIVNTPPVSPIAPYEQLQDTGG